jgi:hypothetical protein
MNVFSLAVSGNTIYAGTNSGGVWRRPISEVTRAINQAPRHVMPNFNIRAATHVDHRVTIEFSLPHSDQVTVEIYNLSGRKITTLANKNFSPGVHIISWNSKNSAAGCYVVKMKAGLNTYVKNIPFFR